MKQCWWVLVVLVIGVILFMVTYEPRPAEPLGSIGTWKKVGGDYEVDISGLVFLERSGERTRFLVCHDNKYPDEDRVGVLTLAPHEDPQYRPLAWPDSIEKPIDIESLAPFSWDGVDTVYLSMTSRGLVTIFSMDSLRTRVEVLEQHQLPVQLDDVQYEGICATRIGDRVLGAWGHRGADDEPGVIYWAWFEPDSDEITVIDSVRYSVPWPTRSEVRHISEMKFDDAGVLYVTAASEATDDGPFDGACYIAGAFRLEEERPRLVKNEPPIRVFEARGFKIEGFDFIRGGEGGIVYGTDNENEGAFLYYYGEGLEKDR